MKSIIRFFMKFKRSDVFEDGSSLRPFGREQLVFSKKGRELSVDFLPDESGMIQAYIDDKVFWYDPQDLTRTWLLTPTERELLKSRLEQYCKRRLLPFEFKEQDK